MTSKLTNEAKELHESDTKVSATTMGPEGDIQMKESALGSNLEKSKPCELGYFPAGTGLPEATSQQEISTPELIKDEPRTSTSNMGPTYEVDDQDPAMGASVEESKSCELTNFTAVTEAPE